MHKTSGDSRAMDARSSRVVFHSREVCSRWRRSLSIRSRWRDISSKCEYSTSMITD